MVRPSRKGGRGMSENRAARRDPHTRRLDQTIPEIETIHPSFTRDRVSHETPASQRMANFPFHLILYRLAFGENQSVPGPPVPFSRGHSSLFWSSKEFPSGPHPTGQAVGCGLDRCHTIRLCTSCQIDRCGSHVGCCRRPGAMRLACVPIPRVVRRRRSSVHRKRAGPDRQ